MADQQALDEVVRFTSDLIRIDTTNRGGGDCQEVLAHPFPHDSGDITFNSGGCIAQHVQEDADAGFGGCELFDGGNVPNR